MKRLSWLFYGMAILFLVWLCVTLPTGTREAAASVYAPEIPIGSGTVNQVDSCQVEYRPSGGSSWSSVQNGTTLYQNDTVKFGSYMMQRLSNTGGSATNFYTTVFYPSSRPATYTAASGSGYEGFTMKNITETDADGNNKSVSSWKVTHLSGTAYVYRGGSDVVLSVNSVVYPGELVKFAKTSVARLHAKDSSGSEMDYGFVHAQNVVWGGDPPPRRGRCSQFTNPYGQPQ